MKVLFVSHSSDVGGAELSLLELITGLRRRGVECVALLPSSGVLQERLRAIGVTTRIVRYCWWCNEKRRVIRNLRNLLASLKIAKIAAQGFDLVYTNTSVVPVGALAAKLAGVAHVWHIREFGWDDHRLHYDCGYERSMRLGARLSDHIIVNSEAVRSSVAPCTGDRPVTRIYGSARQPARQLLERRTGPRSPALGILVGNMQPGKGQRDAVRAISILKRRGRPARLKLMGSGPDEGQIRSMVRADGLEDLVEIAGRQEDVYPAIADADFVLSCAHSEAFGRTIVEGMLLGRAVISSRSGAATELVQDNVTGLLYTPGDPESLADKIEALAADHRLAEQLGRAGRQRARHVFTQDKMIEGVLQVMTSVMDKRRISLAGAARRPISSRSAALPPLPH